MAYDDAEPRLVLRLPEAPEALTAIEVGNVLADFNSIYEFMALSTLPGYEDAYIPSQVRLRRHSRLARHDQLGVGRLQYGSPLEIVYTLSPAFGAAAGLAWGTAMGVVKSLPTLLETRDKWHKRHLRDSTFEAQLDAMVSEERRANEAAEDFHQQARAQERLTNAQAQRLELQNLQTLADRRAAAAASPRPPTRIGGAGRAEAAALIGELLDRISETAGELDAEYIDPATGDADAS